MIYDIKKGDLAARVEPERSFSPNINKKSRAIVKEKAEKYRRLASRSPSVKRGGLLVS